MKALRRNAKNQSVERLYGPGDDPLLRNRMENAGKIGFESGEQKSGSTGVGHACESVFVTGCAFFRWACCGLPIEGAPPEMSTRMEAPLRVADRLL